MEPAAKRSRICLSTEKKLEVISYIERNPLASQGDVGRHFGIAQPSVSTLIKKKSSILELAATGKKGVKKNRTSNCIPLEQSLQLFYEACLAKKLTSITYDTLICKGRELADEIMKREIVEAKDLPSTDSGWKSYVQRFLSKRNIKSKKTHGEAADADVAAAESFFSNDWPEIFSSVNSDCGRVWNMDETGLFWRALPRRTLAKTDVRVSGSKTQKERITFATTVSMTGERLPLLGIGPSKMPRAVAAVKSSPAAVLGGQWSSNPKAWMNQQVFAEWLLGVNAHFRRKGSKIVMLVDNCPGHKMDSIKDRLDYVRVVFLPPNVTSICQPCDAGLIQAFKCSYRRMMLRRVAQLVDDNTVDKLNTAAIKKHITILHCLQYAKAAWESISAITIKNCWRKAGFDSTSTTVDESDTASQESARDDLDEDIEELANLDESEPCRIAPSDNVGEIVTSLESAPTEAEDDDHDDDGPEEILEPPSSAALLQALDTVRSAMYACNADANVHGQLTKLETYLVDRAASRKRQSTLAELWHQ